MVTYRKRKEMRWRGWESKQHISECTLFYKFEFDVVNILYHNKLRFNSE